MALRLVIGWHFYREGADKIAAGNWTSAGFMRVAKGPLTPVFHWFLYDGQGLARLDKEATLDAWDQYRQRVVDHYRFDEKQTEQAQRVFDTRKGQLEWFFDSNQGEIDQYYNGLERVAKYNRERGRAQVASLRDQIHQIEREAYGKLVPWLASLDSMWAGYESDMNALATDEQARRGRLALPAPGRKLLDTKFIDVVIPYFDVIVGAFLILGFCTRLSALAAAGFLASIIATQWPGAEGAEATNYQQIEMVALLVIAAVGAGRFAGLDYFVYLLWRRCCPSIQKKQENNS
ncbi:MAG: DoxX family membrane protein [Pirellulaceae bacterium]|nr:DoxX family membrane protein [Pirellulaceae bacterium]